MPSAFRPPVCALRFAALHKRLASRLCFRSLTASCRPPWVTGSLVLLALIHPPDAGFTAPARKNTSGTPLAGQRPAAAAPKPAAPNLLTNGELAAQGGGWELEQGTGPARASLEWLPSQVTPGGKGGAARITVTATNSSAPPIQFLQRNLTLRDGEPYTLTFWARADRQRPISVAANVTEQSTRTIGLLVENVPLTQDWRKFTLAFTAVDTLTNRCCLTFILGGALGSVELEGIALRPGLVGKPGEVSLVRNGDFSADGANWELQQGIEGSQAKIEWSDDPDSVRAPAKVARIQVGKRGTLAWHVQLIQSGLDLREGESYLLTFWARADQPRPITLQTIQDMADWHPVGLTTRVHVEREWHPYQISLTALNTVARHSQLSFLLGEALGEVELANVTLRPQKGDQPAVSASPRLVGIWSTRRGAGTEQFSFTFNADGTGSLREGFLPATPAQAPRKPVLNPFLWYVDGKDIILAGRRHSWTIQQDGHEERLTLKPATGRTYVLYRQPASR